MRQTFHLVRGPGLDERFERLEEMAARIHALRGDREIHLADQHIGHTDGAAGDCVTLRAGENRQDLIGYALFPETRAYLGDGARLRLVKALLDQRPDLHRGSDGERVTFTGEAA